MLPGGSVPCARSALIAAAIVFDGTAEDFKKFQRNYLAVYLLMVMADWMQVGGRFLLLLFGPDSPHGHTPSKSP